jgi:hypothetical protein
MKNRKSIQKKENLNRIFENLKLKKIIFFFQTKNVPFFKKFLKHLKQKTQYQLYETETKFIFTKIRPKKGPRKMYDFQKVDKTFETKNTVSTFYETETKFIFTKIRPKEGPRKIGLKIQNEDCG